MAIENKENLLVKFPEENSQNTLGSPPNNPVDKAADFLPRALAAIKENFREAVFLFGMLGFIFIAAFGHMEKLHNYISYFFVLVVAILVYKIWEKIHPRDVIYWIIIIALGFYILFSKFNTVIVDWINKQ